mmetsp:Transcript_57534/g.134839  ORF Transcript_57534/g.134839 Transcript_57534/m.134839 type:complete len:106 (+) Transcript_57534:70-387(+)
MPQHLDLGTEQSLKQLLRPEMHHAIAPWMSQVGELEKRAVLRLVRQADTGPVAGIEKPRGKPGPPTAAILDKTKYRETINSKTGNLSKSQSSPILLAGASAVAST